MSGGHDERPTRPFEKVDGYDAESSLDLEEFEQLQPVARPRLRRLCRWAQVVLVLVALALAAAAAARYGIPLLLEKVVIPFLRWEVRVLSKPLLGLVALACLALLPSVLLPTGPTMWVVGISFGYLWGFCLLMLGAFFGQSLPYCIGHWVLHDRIQAWLSKNPRNIALLRLAETGGWFHQFRVVLLLRLSPFPYALFNYAITATNIHYGPYISGSMLAMIPESFLAIYCGRLMKSLADYHERNSRALTPVEIVSQVVGLCVTGSIMLLGMYYGGRALRDLELAEEAARESSKDVMSLGRQRSAPEGYRQAVHSAEGSKDSKVVGGWTELLITGLGGKGRGQAVARVDSGDLEEAAQHVAVPHGERRQVMAGQIKLGDSYGECSGVEMEGRLKLASPQRAAGEESATVAGHDRQHGHCITSEAHADRIDIQAALGGGMATGKHWPWEPGLPESPSAPVMQATMQPVAAPVQHLEGRPLLAATEMGPGGPLAIGS